MATLKELQWSRGMYGEDIATVNKRWKERAQKEQEQLENERATREETWNREYGQPLLHPTPERMSERDYVLQQNELYRQGWRGSDLEGERPIPPKPPVVYATNIPGRAAQWQGEGKEPTFIAETPQAKGEAEKAGVKEIQKGVEYKEPVIPAKPTGEQLESLELATGFYGQIMQKEGWTVDPRTINPPAKGAEERNKWVSSHPAPSDLKSEEYKVWEKQANSVGKYAQEVAQHDYSRATELWKETLGEMGKKEVRDEARRAREENRQARIKAAVDETEKIRNNWESYDLTAKQKAKIMTTPTTERIAIPTGARMKQDIINSLNQLRARAGLLELTAEVGRQEPGEYIRWFPYFNRGRTETTWPEREVKYVEKGGGGGKLDQYGHTVGETKQGTGKYAGMTFIYKGNNQWQSQ